MTENESRTYVSTRDLMESATATVIKGHKYYPAHVVDYLMTEYCRIHQTSLIKYAEKVKAMRKEQTIYFRTRKNLESAMSHEKSVDLITSAILDNQLSLFSDNQTESNDNPTNHVG